VTHEELQATAHRRLNVGCGEYLLRYFTNLDSSPDSPADIHATVPPLPFDDESLDEISACHFLEHLRPEIGREFLAECYRCLVPGGKLGVVVPDTFEIMRCYVNGSRIGAEYPAGVWWETWNLDAICTLFIFSTVQESAHQWMYDLRTLHHTMSRAGFEGLREVDRYRDPRLGAPAWYQGGYDGWKPT
jgi:predicted SAM-dependent methyltransferase